MISGENVVVSGVVVFRFVSLLIFETDCQVLSKKHKLLPLYNYIAFGAGIVLRKTRALAPSGINFQL